MQTTPKRPARQWIFILITVVCLLFALVYVFGSARKNSVLAIDPAVESPLPLAGNSPLRPENGGVRPTWSGQPHLISINETSSADLGKVEMAPLTGGVGPKTMTGLKCERVYYAADKGICLTREVSYVTAKTTAIIFGPDFRPQSKFSTPGIPSRARISPDGRRAAFTVFVIGHSYADLEMSTATFLLDTATGVPIANLEEFAVWRAGALVQAPDFNFWGVTFARDSNSFYATLRYGGKAYLVHGDIKARKVEVLRENVECPSLSPDGTRLVFKKLIARATWRLTALDLTTFTETPLAEAQSIDDQAEWLDNNHVLYGAVDPNPPPWMSIMVVPADGSGQPQVFAAGAVSPAVVQ